MSSVFEGGSLVAYRQSLGSVKPLDRDVERALSRRWRAGDAKAGEKIVEACLPFVIAIALEYRRWGIPLEDIVQQGNVGLLRAAKKFDPERECRLATYAAYWIRAEIREYVVRAYRIVRMGTTKAERRALRAYRTMQQRDPDTLARVSGLSRERIEIMLPVLASRESSLDATSGDVGPAVERMSARGPSPEEEAAEDELREHASTAIAAAMEHLSDRERLIVRERLMSDEPPTLQELGVQLGVSKERVRQLEERARVKLRAQLEDLRDLVA